MVDRNPAYLVTAYVSLVLFSVLVLVSPVLFVRRYRFYAVQLRGTVYQKLFEVGWPLTSVGYEVMSLGCAMVMLWLLGLSPLDQNLWIILACVIFSLGILGFLAGQSVMYWRGDPFRHLRQRARRTSPEN